MSGVLETTAGRADQEGASHVEYLPEPLHNQNAARSPDQNQYEAYPGRCIQLKLDGGRCKGKAIPSKNDLCMVHARKEPVHDED